MTTNREVADFLLDMIIYHGKVYRFTAIKEIDKKYGQGEFTYSPEPGLTAISKPVMKVFAYISKGKVTYSQKNRCWTSDQLGTG